MARIKQSSQGSAPSMQTVNVRLAAEVAYAARCKAMEIHKSKLFEKYPSGQAMQYLVNE